MLIQSHDIGKQYNGGKRGREREKERERKRERERERKKERKRKRERPVSFVVGTVPSTAFWTPSE
jgi:hypothetical protein